MGKWVHRLSDVDGENMKAVCAHCGPVPIVFKGYSRHEGRQRLYACERGQAARSKDRHTQLMTATHPHYVPPRNGTCPLCERNQQLVWDHDHVTNEYRDHICRACNLILGLSQDAPETLVRAAQYLLKHK